MERDGTIYQIGGPGSKNIKTGWGPLGAGLSNANVVGMEVIAKDDKDVTPAQVAAAKQFIQQKYPNTPVFGHGEVNPGHKEADEGMTIVSAIRRDRQAGGASTPAANDNQPSVFEHGTTPYTPYRAENENPIMHLKVDNRSDHDVSASKTSSDNDHGSRKQTQTDDEGKTNLEMQPADL
jgi:hypothetical protein